MQTDVTMPYWCDLPMESCTTLATIMIIGGLFQYSLIGVPHILTASWFSYLPGLGYT